MRTEEPEHDQPLGFLLGAAARKVAKAYAAALAGSPVTPSQFYLLRQLGAEEGVPFRELAERAQLDATSATWLVDQLEKAGMVERRRTDRDRRVVRVWLTPFGGAVLDDAGATIARADARIARRLLAGDEVGSRTAPRAWLTKIAASLPEGDDLWAERSASLDRALDAFKTTVEGGTNVDAPDRARPDDRPGAGDHRSD